MDPLSQSQESAGFQRIDGKFDAAALQRAFSLIQENNLYGSFTISDGEYDLCVFFTRGGLRLISAGRRLPLLSKRLHNAGFLDDAKLKAVEKALDPNGKARSEIPDEREFLVQNFGLPLEEIDAVARVVITESVLDTLFWDEPRFEANEGEPSQAILARRDLSSVTLSLGIKDLIGTIQGKVRSLNEIRRTVNNASMTVEPTAEGRAQQEAGQVGDGAGAATRARILNQVIRDPGLRVRELGRRLKLGELELASHLHELNGQGLVTLQRRALDAKEELERVRKLEHGLDDALSQLLRRIKLADGSARAGDGGRAARHMARAGELLIGEGRDEDALRSFRGALEHAPEDLEAREGLVQTLWNTGRNSEAATESQALGQRYLTLNLPNRALKVLQRALGHEETTNTLDLVVQAYTRQGDTRRASETGSRLINRLLREGKRDEAAQLAAELQEADRRAGSRLLWTRGDMIRIGAMTLVGLALCYVLQIANEGVGVTRAYADDLQQSARLLDQADDFDSTYEATAGLEEQVRTWQEDPWVGEHAQELLRRVWRQQTDLELLTNLRDQGHLPWEASPDAQLALEALRNARPQSEALQEPLQRTITELSETLARCERQIDKLAKAPPSPDGVVFARDLLEEFPNFPGLIRRAFLRVEVTSDPPGAEVRYGGIRFSEPTPMVISVYLTSSRELELFVEGHRTYNREVSFSSLGGNHILHCELIPRRGRPPRQPNRPPADDPEDDPDAGTVVVEPDGAETEPGSGSQIQVSGGSGSDDEPRERRSLQIELRDGSYTGPQNEFLSFAETEGLFDGEPLSRLYRAIVQVVNERGNDERGGDQMRLLGLRIYLVVRTSSGWKVERQPVEIELPEPVPRPMVSVGEGLDRRVPALEDTPGLNMNQLRRMLRDGLDRAVRYYLQRRRDSLRRK